MQIDQRMSRLNHLLNNKWFSFIRTISLIILAMIILYPIIYFYGLNHLLNSNSRADIRPLVNIHDVQIAAKFKNSLRTNTLSHLKQQVWMTERDAEFTDALAGFIEDDRVNKIANDISLMYAINGKDPFSKKECKSYRLAGISLVGFKVSYKNDGKECYSIKYGFEGIKLAVLDLDTSNSLWY